MTDETRNKLDGREAAEDYRHQRQATEARATGFDALPPGDFIAWMEAHDAQLVEIAERSGPDAQAARAAVDEYKTRLRTAPPGGPFDDTNFRIILHDIVREIEDLCHRGKVPIRDGVAFGVSPRLGLQASQLRVLDTDASIISVTLPFIPFCNLISKTLAHCLPIDAHAGGSSICHDPLKVAAAIRRRPILFRHWFRILRSYAIDGWPPPRPSPQVSGIRQSAVRALLLQSMELFAVAHEYGHHVLRHGEVTSTDVSDDNFRHEYEADMFAQLVSAAIGSNAEPPNLYAMSGVGAILILGTLDMVRRARSVLLTGEAQQPLPDETHPPFHDRIQKIALLDANAPEDYREAYIDMRVCFLAILESIWTDLEPCFKRLHARGARPNPQSPDAPGWLPLSQPR